MLRRLLALLLLALSGAAGAHELSIAEMEVRQLSANEFLWMWTASGNRPAGEELTPRWPEGCAADSNRLRCGPEGLAGTLAVEGVGRAYSAAIVKVFWGDGNVRAYTFTGAQPTAQLYGSAEDRRGAFEVARAYALLGVEHILSGWDHLAFVLGLLFLVGFQRRLVTTITAFTLAHSLTLVLAALGWLVLRPPPVEAAIALSILLVAAEALHDRPTFTRRWPALVAFVFGLVHGLGFAGALKDVGLPQHQLTAALLSFNLGVEAGQLLVVGAAFALCKGWARFPGFERARAPALYAIGGVAAYWAFGRIGALATVG